MSHLEIDNKDREMLEVDVSKLEHIYHLIKHTLGEELDDYYKATLESIHDTLGRIDVVHGLVYKEDTMKKGTKRTLGWVEGGI